MQDSRSPAADYGAGRSRRPDVSFGEIERAAAELLKSGKRPTVEGIKALCGGSPHTILRALPGVWLRLGRILEGDPTASTAPPREIVDLATQLWDRARAWAIQAAQRDQEHAEGELARLRQEVELRHHTLGQRERDLESQLLEQRQAARVLHERLAGAMNLYEQERIRNGVLERRLARSEAALKEERGRFRTVFASLRPTLRLKRTTSAPRQKSLTARPRRAQASRRRGRQAKRRREN